jgi:hypothetical protein
VEANVARFESHVPTGATIEQRLSRVGAAILHWVLVSDTVGLMRLGIAEARRFPELASSVHGMARERAVEAISRLLAEVAQSEEDICFRHSVRSVSQQRPECLLKSSCCPCL